MQDVAKYEFNIVRGEGGGVFISMPEEDRKTYGFETQPPRVWLGSEPTPEKSIEIVKAAVNVWYVLCAGIATDRILTEITEFHDDGYPKSMTLSVQ